MVKSKVREDVHGLYVRTDGHVYRPQPSRHSYPSPWAAKGSSKYKAGDEVLIEVASPYCKVKPREEGAWEGWHDHGVYAVSPRKKPEECWEPLEERAAWEPLEKVICEILEDRLLCTACTGTRVILTNEGREVKCLECGSTGQVGEPTPQAR